jgi:tetratricopeptide (TPR) repeat protein
MRLLFVALAAPLLTTGLGAQSIRVGESVEELEARARRDSTDAAAHYNVALGYLSRRRWNEADSALARALRLDPQFAPAWLARSVVHDRDERFWNDTRRRGPGDSARIAEIRQRVRFERRAYLIDPFVDLRVLGGFFRFEDYRDALTYYFGRDVGRFSDGMRLGLRGLVEGNAAAAFDGFEMALGAWYGMTGVRYRDSVPEYLLFYHGMAAARSSRLPAAIQDFERLVARNIAAETKDTTRFHPLRTNEYRYVLAALHQRAGDEQQAMQLYREVAENDLGNYMVHVQVARMAEAAGNWEGAITARRAAADINGDDHTMFLDLGQTLARAGRFAAAETALTRAQEMQPLDSRVAYRLGVVQQLLGKREEARHAFERFLALAPSRFTGPIADARQRLAALT